MIYAQSIFFCGSQKLKTLNNHLFRSNQNLHRHFSAVYIVSN